MSLKDQKRKLAERGLTLKEVRYKLTELLKKNEVVVADLSNENLYKEAVSYFPSTVTPKQIRDIRTVLGIRHIK